MRFDWQRFCDEHRIPYVTRGANTARGNISIHCPFCGPADESEHMGLSLDVNRPLWGCWRGRDHRGGDPTKLIARLLGIGWEQARSIVENQMNNPDAFQAARDALAPKGEEAEKEKPVAVAMPSEFREFNVHRPSMYQQQFETYLRDRRGFGPAWRRVVTDYNLRWCITGEQAWRIVVPVYYKGNLVSWTGRAISPNEELRYKALDAAREARNIKDCLLGPRGVLNLKRKAIVITEGPFDALKFDAFARPFGVTTVCVFGLTLSNAQMNLLVKLRDRYRKWVVLLDSTDPGAAIRMRDQLSEILRREISVGRLPGGVKDPGELSSGQVHKLAREFTEEA